MLIYISFKKWLFISFVHLTNWFIFSLLSLSFLHILKTNPFEMYNLHVFSGFLWVSTSLKVSLSGTNVFNFHEVYFMFFFFLLLLVSGIIFKRFYQTQEKKELLLCFLIRVLQFYLLHLVLWSILSVSNFSFHVGKDVFS